MSLNITVTFLRRTSIQILWDGVKSSGHRLLDLKNMTPKCVSRCYGHQKKVKMPSKALNWTLGGEINWNRSLKIKISSSYNFCPIFKIVAGKMPKTKFWRNFWSTLDWNETFWPVFGWFIFVQGQKKAPFHFFNDDEDTDDNGEGPRKVKIPLSAQKCKRGYDISKIWA